MSVNAASSSATVLVLSMWRFNSENVRVDSPSWSSPLVSTCNVLVMCKISTRDGARRRAAVTSRACVTAIDEEELMLSVNTGRDRCLGHVHRSEEHTSELQSLMRISYDVFCLQ